MMILSTLFFVLNLQAAEPVAQVPDELDLSSITSGENAETTAVDVNPSIALQESGAVAPSLVKEATKNLKESEIPVFTESKKAKEISSPQPVKKMALSLAIVISVIVGAGFFVRRWLIQKKASTPNTQIRIITQHYLGPKKSLAIVHVAGESLLLGITDQNIQLIKGLSLIDDEVPADLPRHFDESLGFIEENQPEPGENFSMRGIKQIVSSRLKNMREI